LVARCHSRCFMTAGADEGDSCEAAESEKDAGAGEEEEEDERGNSFAGKLPRPSGDGWECLMGGLIWRRTLQKGQGPMPEIDQDIRTDIDIGLYFAEEPIRVLQQRRGVSYRLGEGEALPAVELCLRQMAEGEISELVCCSRMAWGSDGCRAATADESAIPPDTDLHMHVTLLECVQKPVDDENGLQACVRELTWRKANGNDYFSRSQFAQAARSYKAALKAFSSIGDAPEEEAASVRALGEDCGSNLAATFLAQSKFVEAKEAATGVLECNPDHVKALYRGAKAAFHLHDFEECELALKRAHELQPDNVSVRQLQGELRKAKREYAEKSKRIAQKVYGGPGPIAQPTGGMEAPSAQAARSGMHVFQKMLPNRWQAAVAVAVLCMVIGALSQWW